MDLSLMEARSKALVHKMLESIENECRKHGYNVQEVYIATKLLTALWRQSIASKTGKEAVERLDRSLVIDIPGDKPEYMN